MTRRDWVGRTTPVLALVALALIGVIVGAHWRGRRRPPPRPRLLAVFLDVGAGDCTLIRTPDGHTALVDAGPAAAEPMVAQTLKRLGIRSLDLLVLTAPAEGNIGGVSALLDNGVGVTQAWRSASVAAGEEGHGTRAALRKHHVPTRTVHQGDRFLLGDRGTRLTALWPPTQGPRTPRDALVCRMDYGETSIVLAGPADGTEEGYLLAGVGQGLACDALQAAAGGADTATSSEMLRRAAPAVAVISSAASSPPGSGTLHRLQAAGAGIWRTDTQGAITLFSDGRGQPDVTAAHM